MKSKIKRFNKEIACESANVKEYQFQGKTVYVFDPGMCGADMTSEVLDSDCNELGYLGGISGNNQVIGASFNTAVYARTVWKQ